MALIAQHGPDEPANSWVFWAILALIVVFVVLVIVVRITDG